MVVIIIIIPEIIGFKGFFYSWFLTKNYYFWFISLDNFFLVTLIRDGKSAWGGWGKGVNDVVCVTDRELFKFCDWWAVNECAGIGWVWVNCIEFVIVGACVAKWLLVICGAENLEGLVEASSRKQINYFKE